MLKRNIAIVIAGTLLSAQATLAAADQGTFPSNDTEVFWKPLPAQLKYLEQRAASIQGTAAGNSFPPSADDMYWNALPAQAKYLEARAASVEKEGVALRGNSFPASADDMYWKMLPAQASYFDQRTATLQARKSGATAPNGE